MATLLKDMKSEGSVAEKVKDYTDANREVAILCNHKRTVPNSHAEQMGKMSEKVCFGTDMQDLCPLGPLADTLVLG